MRKAEELRVLRVDRYIALLTAVAAGIVYFLTLAPSVSFWDSGEYITCSATMGIPHPPGVPLFVLLGRLGTVLFAFLPAVAGRVNLLCALTGTAAIGIMARLVQRWGGRIGMSTGWYRVASVLAGTIAAFSYSIWRNANATETYSTALLFTLVILWAFDTWMARYGERRPAEDRSDRGGWGEARHLLLLSYLIIMAVALHGSVPFITGPSLLVVYFIYAFRGRTRIWRRPWFLLTLGGLAVLAFSVHLYMPLRAVQSPEINETDPSEWESFEKAFSREQYGRTSILDRKGPFPEQIGLYLEYLSWQTGRVDHGWERLLGAAGAPAATVMRILLVFGAIYGLVELGRRKPSLLVLMLMLLMMASILFIFFALNFKTGPEGTEAGEVRERDYFFGASFAFVAMVSGLGLTAAFRELVSRSSRAAWALLLLPAAMLAANWHRCDRSRSYFAHDYGINLLESCPEGAVLITNGDNDTFPLWFAQGVLGVRRDVIVSNLSLMNTNWYVEQLLERDPLLLEYGEMGIVDSLRPVFVWGPHQFHVTEDSRPVTGPMDGTILRATFDQAWPWAIMDGRVSIAMPTEGLGSQGALTMQDLVLLKMIERRPVHGREVYFAGTVARDSRRYLESYQEMEGIAFRVTREPVVDAVDAARGWELLSGYRFTGVTDPGVFKCDQTIQLLRNYASAYHQLAYHYMAVGEPDSAQMALDESEMLFSTLPRQWARILPSRALIVARLVDGTRGAAAARDTLLAIADYLEQAAREYGSEELQSSAMYMTGLANGMGGNLGYRQEEEYDAVFDSLDDGSEAFEWLRVELDLMFTDYLGAWERVRAMEPGADGRSGRMAALALEELTRVMETTPVTSRIDLTESGISILFDHIDPQVTDSVAVSPESDAASIASDMASVAARGQYLSAASAGLVLSRALDDPDASALLESLADRLLDRAAVSRDEMEWWVLASAANPPEAVAWLSARAGLPELMYVSLSGSGLLDDGTLAEILADPAGYARGMPEPGNGSGAYAWVNALEGGE